MKFYTILLTFLIFLFFSLNVKSDIPPAGCDPGLCPNSDNTDCIECAEIPIDGGASLLLIAGGVYGVNKIRNYRKLNNSKATV